MPRVVVLGSGVLGLSIAQELVDRKFQVTIVAKDFAEDVHSQGFSSPWAGCNWCSFAKADAPRDQTWDKLTYERFSALTQREPELCERIPFYELVEKLTDLPWFDQLTPEFRVLEKDQVPAPYKEGYTYLSYVLNAPLYLQHLSDNLRSKRVQFVKKRITALDECYNLPDAGAVDLVVNASGLGAKSLLGVEDSNVHPIRGQTVLVNSKVKKCYMGAVRPPKAPSSDSAGPNTASYPKEVFYIIPRPGSINQVIIGGTFQPDSYDPMPDYGTAQRILERAFQVCPEIASSSSYGEKATSWQDIDVVSHNVGFRPARRGGCRLELERRHLTKQASGLTPRYKHDQERSVGCVHAYGIGPAGYQASLVLAKEAADLCQAYFDKVNG